MNTGAQLHRLERELGSGRHFLYDTSGASLAQWIVAHHDGGRAVAGAVKISKLHEVPSKLKIGEVVEIRPGTTKSQLAQLNALAEQLKDQHLTG